MDAKERAPRGAKREKIKSLYESWEQYASDAQYYEQRAEDLASELRDMGIDPETPPQWLSE